MKIWQTLVLGHHAEELKWFSRKTDLFVLRKGSLNSRNRDRVVATHGTASTGWNLNFTCDLQVFCNVTWLLQFLYRCYTPVNWLHSQAATADSLLSCTWLQEAHRSIDTHNANTVHCATSVKQTACKSSTSEGGSRVILLTYLGGGARFETWLAGRIFRYRSVIFLNSSIEIPEE